MDFDSLLHFSLCDMAPSVTSFFYQSICIDCLSMNAETASSYAKSGDISVGVKRNDLIGRCTPPLSQRKSPLLALHISWKKFCLIFDWIISWYSDGFLHEKFIHFRISSEYSTITLVSVSLLISLSFISYWSVVYYSYFASPSSRNSVWSLSSVEIFFLSFFSCLFVVLLNVICFYRISLLVDEQSSTDRTAFMWVESIALIGIVISMGFSLLFHSFRCCDCDSQFHLLLCSSYEMSNHLSVSFSLVLFVLPLLLSRAFCFVSFSVVFLSFLIALLFVILSLSLKSDASDVSWVVAAILISFWTLVDSYMQSLSYFYYSLQKNVQTSSTTDALSDEPSLTNCLSKAESQLRMNLLSEVKAVGVCICPCFLNLLIFIGVCRICFNLCSFLLSVKLP
jgi:hypothetical protein